MAFMEQYCNKFTDDDENKLEYTPIHEEFIHICEDSIESKLLENFSQEDVDGFYKNFASVYPTFKEKNPDTCDVLNGMIDFSHFKA